MNRRTATLLAVSTALLLGLSAPASAQVAVGGGKLDGQRQFSFAAIQLDDDGTAVGQAVLKNLDTGGRVRVDVNCAVIDGDTAIMTGVVTQVKNGFGGLEVDDEVVLGVRDNGEGSDNPADRITGLFLLPGGTDCDFLTFIVDVVFGGPAGAFAVLGGGEEIASGDIQVLP